MATIGTENLTPGALLELVARGNKDAFFLSKDVAKAESPFNTIYAPQEPRLADTRTQVPSNAPDFGKMIEFQLETWADILTDMYVLIDLPSWLPSLPLVADGTTYPPQESNLQNLVTSSSEAEYTYGWIRGIGYLLFERIQILQDQFLIQDISGDSLLALENTSSTNAQYYLRAAQAGIHNGTAREIAANATPGRLRVRIPFPCLQRPADGGLPLCCLREQNFRIRFFLRSAEKLWESSAPAGTVVPAPWNITFNVFSTTGTVVEGVGGAGRSALGKPNIMLETTQIYISEDAANQMRAQHFKIPFIRYYDETFTIGEADYAAIDRGGTSVIQRRMEGRHPMERLMIYFRRKQWLSDGRLWLIGGEEFYNNIGFQVAGQDREYIWPSVVLHTITGLVKDERYMADRGQQELRWSIPEGIGYNRQPTGTVNFTTASRPTLSIDLKDSEPDPCDDQRTTFMQIVGEAWAIYEIKEGRGRLMFMD
jgi:hypothetical protein